MSLTLRRISSQLAQPRSLFTTRKACSPRRVAEPWVRQPAHTRARFSGRKHIAQGESASPRYAQPANSFTASALYIASSVGLYYSPPRSSTFVSALKPNQILMVALQWER